MSKTVNTASLNIFTLFRCQLAIFILLLLPFSTYAKKETIIWQAGFNYVVLTEADSGDIKNDHPATLTPQVVYQLLASINLKDADKSLLDLDIFKSSKEDIGDKKLFNKVELDRISRPVAKALSNATPGQDVVFTVTSSHKQTLGKSALSTSGRLFFDDGQLNLIIGELRVDIEQKYRQRGGYSDVAEKIDYNKLKNFRLKVGSRRSESDIDYAFVTDDIHILKKARKDWLLINVEALQQQITQQLKNVKRKENIVEESNNIKQKTQQIDKEQEELKQKVERLEKYLEAKERKETTDVIKPKNTPQKKGSVEERLTELKILFDKGVIPKDIYQQKMKDILSDL